MTFMSSIGLIILLQYISIICAYQDVIYVKSIVFWNNLRTKFESVNANFNVYYQPVDDDWRQKTLQLLNLSSNKLKLNNVTKFSNNEILLKYLIPNDIFRTSKHNCLYKSLSYILFGNENEYYYLQKKIMDYLKTNEFPVDFVGGQEMFKLYLDQLIQRNEYQESVIKGNINNENTSEICNGMVEIMGAAFYLNTCILVYYEKYEDWILYHRSWPNCDNVNWENKKCIYLFDDGPISAINSISVHEKLLTHPNDKKCNKYRIIETL
ncbi:uncharacterized protein LOC126907959 [Daktulosphaira vitifoliae]|uniref:uncharacterized protein LOC126907959 n=1 Tax=Daktulosphaira vitifoliae TaxID=58002 RepID=UPI0021AAA89F|nr:uncharacterized protein LOC126907959 [Daktulosphaira vitifoliae]